MPNFTQEYRSTDLGFGPVNGTAGSVIGMLDAVLVNGGTTQSVTSIVEAGTTYTATIPSDTTLETLDHLTLAGITGAGAVLNGVQVITVINGTSFSFTGPGGLGSITGTITYRRSPLGYSKFAGTNVAAYQTASVSGLPQGWVRVDETGAMAGGQKELAVRSYEAMTDVNTGTQSFPSVAQQANGVCWRKSAAADSTSRAWSLIGDGASFYLVINSDNSLTSGRQLYGFGAYDSFKPSDACPLFLSGLGQFNTVSPSSTNNGLGYVAPPASLGAQSGLYLARPISGAVSPVSAMHCARSMLNPGTLGGIQGMVTYPGPPDGSLWVDSSILFDASGAPHGRLRGLYYPCHNSLVFSSDYDTSPPNVAGLGGATLLNIMHAAGSVSGNALFDRYGPW